MDSIIIENRKRVFRQELFKLEVEGYLPQTIVETVAKAHDQYYFDLNSEEIATGFPQVQEGTAKEIKIKQKMQKVKKAPTQEEIRERNITWWLNIGVVFLLIGGLFVATSNWETMTGLMKSCLIALVSLMFYGLAILTRNVLHLDKTAFAFIVLGSLFLPIFILSLGWFGLLGPYLAVDGGGHYYLGMLGSLMPVFIYSWIAKKLSSRLFVWFSYISASAGAAFFFAALAFTIDFFYLGLIAFNAAAIGLYHYIKNKDSIKIFTKEFVPFAQVNLVLCTLFMLLLFDSRIMYSFNLLLTAAVYISMMYVSGKKEYHFVFSTMIVYGAYQLIEHSILQSAGAFLYALVAFGIIFVPKALKEQESLDKAFQYTSAIVSGLAFIYISFQGIILRGNEPSFVLMIAYFIIAANFLYLSHQKLLKILPYLSSVFMASAIYELVSFCLKSVGHIHLPLFLFISGFLQYIVFGVLQLHKHLKAIHISSKDVGMGIMGVGTYLSLSLLFHWELGVMLLLIVLVAYLVFKKENRPILKQLAMWILPSALGLSAAVFGVELNSHYPDYEDQFGNSLNIVVGTILVFASSFVWKKWKEAELNRSSIEVAQILYTISIIFSLIEPNDKIWFLPVILGTAVLVFSIAAKENSIEWKKRALLYGAYLSLFFLISREMLNLFGGYSSQYSFPITSGMISLVLIFAGKDVKTRTTYYLVPFSIVGLIDMLIMYPFDWLPFLVTLFYAAGLVIYLHVVKMELLVIFPLLLSFAASIEFSFQSRMGDLGHFILACGIGILLAFIGQLLYKRIAEKGTNLNNIKIDVYTGVSFLYLLLLYAFSNGQLWSELLPGLLIAAAIRLQRKRVPKEFSEFIVILSAITLLQPYYTLISDINVPSLLTREAAALPWVLLIIFARLKLKGRHSLVTKPIEWGVLIIVSLLLIQDGLESSTIYDAIILGTLSLLSMLSGMMLQLKSYFFIGSGVLLLNVFLQTRPYWGNMPWWGYLLIVGFILITIASFNEWNKQKVLKGESTFITTLKNKTINKIKHWD